MLICNSWYWWRVSHSVTHKHELWIWFTLSYAMMKASHLTCHSVTHKCERWIWFPLSYVMRKALLRHETGRGVERWHCTIYCLKFCAGCNDTKRQHLSTINTNSELSLYTACFDSLLHALTAYSMLWQLYVVKWLISVWFMVATLDITRNINKCLGFLFFSTNLIF